VNGRARGCRDASVHLSLCHYTPVTRNDHVPFTLPRTPSLDSHCCVSNVVSVIGWLGKIPQHEVLFYGHWCVAHGPCDIDNRGGADTTWLAAHEKKHHRQPDVEQRLWRCTCCPGYTTQTRNSMTIHCTKKNKNLTRGEKKHERIDPPLLPARSVLTASASASASAPPPPAAARCPPGVGSATHTRGSYPGAYRHAHQVAPMDVVECRSCNRSDADASHCTGCNTCWVCLDGIVFFWCAMCVSVHSHDDGH
jgi:hypothetical protein